MKNQHSTEVFVSSTVHDLKDVRASLVDFLEGQGLTPMLSCETGFPDVSPWLTPYESCLPVLAKVPLAILVLDERYGRQFAWPNFRAEFGIREISPTHGEYLYGHQRGIPFRVYVRHQTLSHYQTFRRLKKKGLLSQLPEVIPPNIQPELLTFLHEVKTSSPIPWIQGFRDVRDIVRDLKTLFLNHLSEALRGQRRKGNASSPTIPDELVAGPVHRRPKNLIIHASAHRQPRSRGVAASFGHLDPAVLHAESMNTAELVSELRSALGEDS